MFEKDNWWYESWNIEIRLEWRQSQPIAPRLPSDFAWEKRKTGVLPENDSWFEIKRADQPRYDSQTKERIANIIGKQTQSNHIAFRIKQE